MKTLVIGPGGREHALALALTDDPILHYRRDAYSESVSRRMQTGS